MDMSAVRTRDGNTASAPAVDDAISRAPSVASPH
jgi:hypothetical protein